MFIFKHIYIIGLIHIEYLENNNEETLRETKDTIVNLSNKYDELLNNVKELCKAQRKQFEDVFSAVFNKYPLVFDNLNSTEIYEVYSEVINSNGQTTAEQILKRDYDYLLESLYNETVK